MGEKTTVILVLVISLAFLGIGFWLTGREERHTFMVGPDDNGRLLDVDVGDTVIIRLPENPSTGYTWQYVLDENIAEVRRDDFEPLDNVPGKGGTRLLELKIIDRGVEEVIMNYVRPLENKPAEQFSLILKSEVEVA